MKTAFDLTAYMKTSTQASGVSLKVEDTATLRKTARAVLKRRTLPQAANETSA